MSKVSHTGFARVDLMSKRRKLEFPTGVPAAVDQFADSRACPTGDPALAYTPQHRGGCSR